jgi:nucleotide-binding universal stress UspA family protein
MYRRIVLAYDGSREGRAALREGALLALTCRAEVFLLSVLAQTPGVQLGEGALPGTSEHRRSGYEAILQEGAERLRTLGFEPTAMIAEGEPARVIAGFAKSVSADLVVVGHRRQSGLARWWAGSTGAYLLDYLGCSLLVARSDFTDEQFEAVLARLGVKRRTP